MADFGYFSDTDDSVVEELISQMKDLSVLEQVSKINSSGLTDSLLPTDLDNRFQKLKSFSISKPDFNCASLDEEKTVHCSVSDDENPDEKGGSLTDVVDIFSDAKQNPDGKKCLKKKDNSNNEHGSYDSSLGSASKSISGSFRSPLGSSKSSMHSPPRKTGCFWCSPKKVSKKNKKENLNMDWGNIKGECEYDDGGEFLSVLSSFSSKEQEKILKKAMKEEEKISKEAEKIVKWAKQASNRISFHGESSGDDDGEKKNFEQ